MCPPISAFLPGEEEQRLEHYRRMSIDDKFKEIGILNRLHAERERADIRARYGNIPESEMRVRIGVLRYGRETMENVTNARHVVQSSDCCGNSLK